MSTRAFALMRTEDQWRRASHKDTALIGEVVQLAWKDEDEVRLPAALPPWGGGGLAFDAHCRLYHSVPDEGRIERLLWAVYDPLRPAQEHPTPLDLFATTLPAEYGDFTLADEPPTALLQPRGLVVDEDGRLFIAETGSRRILIYDLPTRRLLRQVALAASPLDLMTDGHTVTVVVTSPPGLLELDARTEPRPLVLPDGVSHPSRMALSPAGEIFLLESAGTADAGIFRYGRLQDAPVPVPFATDLEFGTCDPAGTTGRHIQTPQVSTEQTAVLVVARRPGEDFLRFRVGPTAWDTLPPLKGRSYDGWGIVRTPDNRIGFWTGQGFRLAVPARLRYLPSGHVTSFRLDSGAFYTVWGRLFLDACIPRNTEVRVHYVTTDEPAEGETLPRNPPVNIQNMELLRPDLSPPMPPLVLDRLLDKAPHALHRRETGRELPWARFAAGDAFVTCEAPIIAPPGRYLWVRLALSGNTRFTPQIRALRAEYPSHDYLRRLPKTFARDEQAAAFLRRYLAMFEGMLGELDAKAAARHALFQARSAPAEILPWLAGFLGLVLDERWSVDTRRTLIEEAIWLFRFRGTVRGLSRFLEIYTGTSVILIEKFRVRGLGGMLLGEPGNLQPRSVLGAGFRIGGAIGEPETVLLEGEVADAFATHAHRFSVVIPALLTEEQTAVVQQILDLHRPAHTLVDVCTVGAGMRVGRGLHVALTSMIGRTGGFVPLQVGSTPLGRGATVGQAQAGTQIGSGRLGGDTRIG